jgi:hypothetical protein
MAVNAKYSNGQKAICFNDDGTGFVYYPNGAVAITVSSASDYQNSYCAFDKDRRNSALFALDQYATGFASSATRRSFDSDKVCVVMSKRGCMVSRNDVVTNEWLWDRKALNAGVPPASDVIARLNEHITFIFIDRNSAKLSFSCDGIEYKIDVAAKYRRTDNYLTNCKRDVTGHLVPQIEYVSLPERIAAMNEALRAQRNKLRPRSENLSDLVKDIVAGLENQFDSLSNTMNIGNSLGSTWKSSALDMTIGEIPRIAKTGTERFGATQTLGFGDSIFVDSENLAQTLPARLTDSKGHWLGEVELRSEIRKGNPPLRRTQILKANSGRYSSELVINSASITADNPTGMVIPPGIPLSRITWKKLKEDLKHSNVFTVVLAFREGDAYGHVISAVANVLNERLINDEKALAKAFIPPPPAPAPAPEPAPEKTKRGSKAGKDVKAAVEEAPAPAPAPARPPVPGGGQKTILYFLDVSESCEIVKELGIQTLPVWLMYRGSQLVYSGSIAGKKPKVQDVPVKTSVLLIEPDFKHQGQMEKSFKQIGCDISTCMNVTEAIERVRILSQTSREHVRSNTQFKFDLIAVSQKIPVNEWIQLTAFFAEPIKTGRTVLTALCSFYKDGSAGGPSAATSTGKKVNWVNGATDQVKDVLPSELVRGEIALVMQKPLRTEAIRRALGMRSEVTMNSALKEKDDTYGLTPDSLMAKINEVKGGNFPSGGMERSISTANTGLGSTSRTATAKSRTGTGALAQTRISDRSAVGIKLSIEDVKVCGQVLTR